jgi:ectoine hydroxylase
MQCISEGYAVTAAAFTGRDLTDLRDGVEAAATRAARLAADAGEAGVSRSDRGHRLQTVPGDPATHLHWEPDTAVPTVRNLYPVTHLDHRLHARWTDPRLTGPAAELLGTDAVSPLSSKISFKRARVGSEFIWHQDHTFLARFLGPAAREVVTAMVLLDDADAANGALTVVPGSHRGEIRDDDEPPRPGDAEPVLLEAPAGTVLFFHSLVLHRSDENRSDRDRRAMFYLFRPA